MAPISFGLFCAKSETFSDVIIGAVYSLITCIIACGISLILLNKIKKDQEILSVRIVDVVKIRGGASTYFLAYILPLILGDKASLATISLLLVLIFFVSLFTETEENNPIIRLMGLGFYNMKSFNGESFVVMSKDRLTDILQESKKNGGKLDLVSFDEDFFMKIRK